MTKMIDDPLLNLAVAKELAAFQAEPQQMPSAAKGKCGRLQLKFKKTEHKTELNYLFRQAPLLVQRALYNDDGLPDMPVCSVISVGGGMLQGDRNQIEIHLNKDASAHITTQGASRIQQMDANYASQYQQLILEENSYLEYLPDITIPYKHARFISQTDIILHPTAILFYGEIFMGGRKHHGNERFEFDVLSIKNRILNPQNELRFTEKLLYQQQSSNLDSTSVMANFDVFANVIVAAPPNIVKVIQNGFPCSFDYANGCAYGISLLPNHVGLALRVVGKETHQVKAVVKKLWQRVRQSAKNSDLSRAKMNPVYL